MSCYTIHYNKGAKLMRPILSREEYLQLRDSSAQKAIVDSIRKGSPSPDISLLGRGVDTNASKLKMRLLQMNYSCIPGEDMKLKGCTTPSNTVGMDIDHIDKEQMQEVRERIVAKKDELGLLMLELSARGEGYHLVFKRRPELSQEDNLRWASDLLGVKYDEGAKDITRVFFTTTASEEDLIYLDDELFTPSLSPFPHASSRNEGDRPTPLTPSRKEGEGWGEGLYLGIPYSSIIQKWWQMYNDGQEPCSGNRNTLTFELAVNLRHICGFDRELMKKIIPDYWESQGEASSEKMKCIDSALSEKRTQMPKRLKEVLLELRCEMQNDQSTMSKLEEVIMEDDKFFFKQLPKMPQGVKDSIDAVGPALAMPILTAICPAIGMLASGVKLDIHGKKNSLNLISYIAGDFASGKGSIDPVIEAWMKEVKAMDKMYIQQEDEWRRKKRAAKNKKEQPEEPKLPVRWLTLNNTVANLAERLANTDGRHAFSFTPEADTVAQKWKSAMSDFSVMLRQAYDGSPYEREARSAEAVNVHIDSLLWNVVMCGTPDALYRVVNNYTDGFQSRIALSRTPDNTFTPLTENLRVLTDRQEERIHQVAHLLPLMNGEIVLPKLEERGRAWLEQVRLESMKNDDKTKARQRFRICPTTMRMMCCLMLCKVCDKLIAEHGLHGAEVKLKQNPEVWKDLIVKTQTPQMLAAFDVIAESLMDNALHFFRERIENAFSSRDYAGTGIERKKRGRNDSIFSRLDTTFTFEQALQQSIAIKGSSVNNENVRQMLKNWRKQGLAILKDDGRFQKIANL